MTNLYETLGVKKDATKKSIRLAFKKLARKHHPDKGGDVEKFQAVSTAYNVLYDDEARARYDRDGTVRAEPTITQIATQKLAEIFVTLLKANINKLGRVDMVSSIAATIDKSLQEVYANSTELEGNRNNLKAAKRRIKSGPELFKGVIDQEITKIDFLIEATAKDVELLEFMKELSADFDYETDIVDQYIMTGTSGTTSTF